MFNCDKCGIIDTLYIIDIISYNGDINKKCGICEGIYHLNESPATTEQEPPATTEQEPPATTEQTEQEPIATTEQEPPATKTTTTTTTEPPEPPRGKPKLKIYVCKHKQKPKPKPILKCVCKKQIHINKKVNHLKYRMSKRLIMYI